MSIRQNVISLALVAVNLPVFAAGCGAGSSSTSTGSASGSNPLAVAMPVMGITSPTAKSSSSASRFSSLVGNSISNLTGSSSTASEAQPLSETKEELQNKLAKTDIKDCLQGIDFDFHGGSNDSCFGPKVAYKNHPDGLSDSEFGAGDLGIWDATESTGEACVAAKMNQSVGTVGKYANQTLRLMAGMLCAANVKGNSLPSSVGGSIDMTSILNENQTSLTFSSAKISRVGDKDSKATYQMTASLTYTDQGDQQQRPLSLTLTHTPGDSTNATYTGRLKTSYDFADTVRNTYNKAAFSVVYSLTSGMLKYELRYGTTENLTGTATEAATIDPFKTNGDFDFSNSKIKLSGFYGLTEVSESTGLGTIYWVWEPNIGNISRTFQAYTAKGDDGTDAGYGYFGFGPNLLSTTYGTMGGMICSLSTAGGNYQSTKVQAQKITRNGAGVFVPSTDGNYVSFAPTNTCNNTSATFQVKKEGQSSYSNVGTLTNGFVTYGSIGTIPTVTAPTY